MNRLWYHITRLALVVIPVLFAVAPATAQLTAYQGQTTRLSVEQKPGDTYTWDLFKDPSLNFATATSDVSASEAYFVNGVNTGPTVDVNWLQPGTYFYRVMAWNAVQCTNNVKVGIIVIQENKVDVNPPVAYDDYFEASCETLTANLTTNDIWDNNYDIVVSLLDWPTKGELYLDDKGVMTYDLYVGVFGTDSITYKLCLDSDTVLCDTATVYITIPDGLDCTEPTPPVDTTCHFFIPEGFSPNGDGVHDYFVIDCIERYPNAKLMIFDKQGYLLYQKNNYGNPDVWGNNEADLWWGGQTTKHHHNSDHMIVPGVYLYILDKGNGDLARGFVMVAYGKGQ